MAQDIEKTWEWLTLTEVVPGIVEVMWLPTCCNSFCRQKLEMFMVLSAYFLFVRKKDK